MCMVETSVMIYCESSVIICIIICMHVCHTSCTDAKSCHRHSILGGAPKLFISMLHNNYQLFLIYQSDHQYNNYIHTSDLNVTTTAIVKLMHVHDSCSCLKITMHAEAITAWSVPNAVDNPTSIVCNRCSAASIVCSIFCRK